MNKKAALLIVGLCSLQLDASVCPAPYPASNEPSQAHKDKQAAYHRALRFLPFPPELAEVVVAYRMVHVIQNDEEFHSCLKSCTDDGNELESIKDYIDHDPQQRIALRFEREKVTPLMCILHRGVGSKLMRLILSYPQDINTQDGSHDGNTALHMATHYAVPREHLILLIEYGADLDAKNKESAPPWRKERRPLTAKNWAGWNSYDISYYRPYKLLECAHELDQQLSQTMPDLSERRIVVANHLRMVDTASESIRNYDVYVRTYGFYSETFEELSGFLAPVKKSDTSTAVVSKKESDTSTEAPKETRSWLKKLFCC